MTRVMLADDVYKMVKDLGKTAIMVTHDLSEALSVGDKVVVLTKSLVLLKRFMILIIRIALLHLIIEKKKNLITIMKRYGEI